MRSQMVTAENFRKRIIRFINKVCLILSLISVLFICNCNENNENPGTPTLSLTLEEKIDKIAEKNLKVGLSIGLINKGREKLVFNYGKLSLNNDEPPDENTVFDIGSMTKTFTAILLTDTYLNGNFTDDTVSHYLPKGVKMPVKGETPILIFHLLTHTSGLPRSPHADGQSYPLPSNFAAENPYQNYTTEQIYDYLSNYCTLNFEPGTRYEYSNTAFGLLGHIIGLVNGSNYKNVLHTKLFDILGMERSSLFLSEYQLSNCSLGYNTALKNVPNYLANDIFQGAGCIKSTVNDLFKYLEANLGLTETSLKNAMEITHEPQLDLVTGKQGLAWYILELNDGQEIVYSGGDTQGHSSYIGFNKELKTGVIILSNYAMHGSQLDMGHDVMKIINEY